MGGLVGNRGPRLSTLDSLTDVHPPGNPAPVRPTGTSAVGPKTSTDQAAPPSKPLSRSSQLPPNGNGTATEVGGDRGEQVVVHTAALPAAGFAERQQPIDEAVAAGAWLRAAAGLSRPGGTKP